MGTDLGGEMVLFLAILIGTLIGFAHPVVIVAILFFALNKMREREALFCVCTGDHPTRRLIVYGKVF
jgi:hypothetical protein